MKIDVSIEELIPFEKYSDTEKRQQINDIRTSHLSDDMVTENQQLLERCRMFYESLADFRNRRRRAFNYYRGRQWEDLVEDDDGNIVTEEDYIKSRGKIPFKQNVIRQLIRNIIGQMLTNKTKPIVNAIKSEDSGLSEMLTNTLQSIQQLNEVAALDARNFEEFLISGALINKTSYSYWNTKDKEDVYTENINPNYVFFNTDMKDPRLLDLRLIGEIKDATLDDVISTFATNEAEAEKIRSWYTIVSPKNIAVNTGEMGSQRMENMDFYIPSDVTKARVIEVWEKVTDWRTYAHDYMTGEYTTTKLSLEDINAINEERILKGVNAGMSEENIPLIEARRKLEQFWVVKYLTPFGHCLFQGETPYKHQSHPYTVTLFPLLDGEVWGLVEDIIDQQRNINRQFAIMDFILGSAAKGVLLLPEEAIPDDMDIDDYAEEWTKYNGVIKFKAKAGVPLPQQITSNIANIGTITQMIEMQMREIEQIAGVSGAIQGHPAKSGTPNSLYVNEAANSSTNTKDILTTFFRHKIKRDEKMLKVAMQYYNEKRYVAISGNRYSEEANYYDPDRVKDFEFDLVISEGTDTPVYRQIISDQLFQLLQMNKIDIKMFLENSGMPYADQLLANIKNAEEQAAQGQAQQGQLPPEQVQGSPEAQQLMGKMKAQQAA